MKATTDPLELPKRLPPWIRKSLKTDKGFSGVQDVVESLHLHTVCEEAKCPNRQECWNSGTATVMILGDTCTRSCGFCAIKAGRPDGLDRDEPRRVGLSAKAMNLQHIVITSVNRDDLEDGGSEIFAETILSVKKHLPACIVEVLTPDFEANVVALENVFRAAPHVYNHNLETVQRLQSAIRPQASYGRSLETLKLASEWSPRMEVKSGLMVGLGESDEEIRQAIHDLFEAGCTILTIGQYLCPTKHHHPVMRYVEPDVFDVYKKWALDLGFKGVSAGPMVRSSYRADKLYAETIATR